MSTRRSPKPKQLMKAVAIDRFGPPSVLKLRRLPVPELGSREVLIALQGAGVGVWDADIRKGWWPKGRPKFPLILGSDGAGIVVAKGSRVRRFDVGDRVWAYEFINPKGGFYAQRVAVDTDHVGHVPRRMDLLHAGAATVTALTAFQGIKDVLKIRRGQTVLIFGATGAVGSLAIQFAKRRGARVLATASGRKAAKLVMRLGADGQIDARSDHLVDDLRALAPRGVDGILALAGGAPLDQCVGLVKRGGRVAFPNGIEPEPNRKQGVRLLAYDAEASPRHLATLRVAVEKARLRVPIAAAFPLARAAKAHERLERGHVLGRIVLKIPQVRVEGESKRSVSR